MGLLIILGIIVVISVFANLKSLSRENFQLKKEAEKKRSELYALKDELALKTREVSGLTDTIEALHAENSTLRKSLSEAPLGFPSLLEALRGYDFQHDKRLILWLKNKSHPAPTAAEIVKIETRKRRDAELEARRSKLLLEYYFSFYPSTREDFAAKSKQSALLREASPFDKIKELTEHIDILNKQISQLKSELTKTQSELYSVNGELAKETRENKVLSEQNSQFTKNLTRLTEDLTRTNSKLESVNIALTQITRENQELIATAESLRTENNTLRQSLSEAPLGFPSLLEALRLYDFQHDERLAYWLKSKSHSAYTAAEIVKIETRKRRDAELEARRSKLLLDYYFSISPDAQEELEADTEQAALSREAPPQDNTEDIAGRYLSREEYDKLSSAQRNQLALDRFWSWNKSKRMIGRLYEQYIGWLYEREGWLVDYFGISEGFSDLGRDLICHKDNTTLIIQCKNWSKSKRIYEKHIFQLFGTTYEYMKNNPFEEVKAVFFTSTQLSELAHMFAKEFRIELHEGFELKRFPIIKCNVGREGERIYHLPFDQQYYSTKIKPADGDFYCSTTAEAEAQGFRRAYRWHGNREDF